jgi:hypothetical protein
MRDSDNRETTSAAQERAIVHQSAGLALKTLVSVGAMSSTLVMVAYFWRIRYVPIEGFADIASVGGIALMGCLLIIGVLLVLWGAPLFLQWGIWQDEDLRWFVIVGSGASGEKQHTDRNKVLRYAANSIGLGWLGFCIIAFFPEIDRILNTRFAQAPMSPRPVAGLIERLWCGACTPHNFSSLPASPSRHFPVPARPQSVRRVR